MLKPDTCKPCALYSIGNSFTNVEGTGKAGVVLIGEASGHDEAIDCLPFRPKAQAGSKLQECIDAAMVHTGCSREDYLITNIIRCQPPGNKLSGEWYEGSAILYCRRYLKRVLNNYTPPLGRKKIIVALGNTAFNTLTGRSDSVLDVTGYPFSCKIDESYIVLAAPHPSYIRRGNPQLTTVLTEVLIKAVAMAGTDEYLAPAIYHAKKNYRIVGYDEAEAFYIRLKDNPKLINAYDIETENSKGLSEEGFDELADTEITQIQFAVDKYNAIIFPRFDSVYRKISKKIMELPNIKLSFNGWNFDNPRIRAKDIDIDESKVHDLMWMFKHYQPGLPRGLQDVAWLAGFPFAWKQLFGSDMETYGGADVCSLHFIIEKLPKLMKARGVWEGYVRYLYQFRGRILYPASVAGLPVNEERRIELKKKLEVMKAERDRKLQELVPIELRRVTPRKKLKALDIDTGKEVEIIRYGYEREPRELKNAEQEYAISSRKLQAIGKRIVPFEQFLEIKYRLVKRRFRDFDFESQSFIEAERWCKYQPFKASKEQLSDYIRWKKIDLIKQAYTFDPAIKVVQLKYGTVYRSTVEEAKQLLELAELYEIPTNHEGKETTNKKELEIFLDKTGDEVVENVQVVRSLNTNLTNYIPNWQPSKDGAVHTTWSFTAASGQINSSRPNVLNVSKHTDIGQLFRRIIEAPKGWSWLEGDKKSFHVAMMGYVANDPTYIRFSQLDPHSIFTSFIMPKDWGKPVDMTKSDGEILEYCKWIKKRCKEEKAKLGDRGIDIRQDQAKPCVLGNQLGLGPVKLWWQNRRTIKDKKHAELLQTTLADMFDGRIEAAKQHIKDLAYKQTYLLNDFGHIQHFFDVYNWVWDKRNAKWIRRDGEEARDAIAFAVQSPAFGMIKDECFRIVERLREEKDEQRVLFRLSIHDSLNFLLPDDKREEYFEEIIKVEMNKPCKKLVNTATGPEGLKVGVEFAGGMNWQSWNAETNPEGMKEF